MAKKILVVDDEAHIRELVRFNLEKEGFSVIEAVDGVTAIKTVRSEKPELVVLDLMLPVIDGLEVCRTLKKDTDTSGIPVIMLTAKSEEIDKILGLEMGADDYLTKPFSPRELLARIKAVMRRVKREPGAEGELVIGNLRINFSRYGATLSGQRIDLTPKEFELMKLFVTNIGKVLTRDYLLEKIWGYEYFGDTRTVDVHVRHLRSKLEKDPDLADAIETVRGVGYRFKETTTG
jgi:two-component system, OmpR family, alkaline phosphatase synthesis response regulator PhoP